MTNHPAVNELLELAKSRGYQVAQVGTPMRGKRPDFIIVDDGLKPIQPVETTEMKPLKRIGLLAAVMAALPSMAFVSGNELPHSYGSGLQTDFLREHRYTGKHKMTAQTKGKTHKKNLRASKRNGKSYKVRKA